MFKCNSHHYIVVRDALAGTDAMGMWDNDEHLSITFGKWKVDVKEEGVAGSTSRTMEWFLKHYKASAGRMHLTQRMTKRQCRLLTHTNTF